MNYCQPKVDLLNRSKVKLAVVSHSVEQLSKFVVVDRSKDM